MELAMVGNKNVVADMTNLHSKTEFSSVDEDSGRLTTTGKTPAVPSVHPAERAAVAAQIYGLVVKIWPAHCHFYASADYYGSHNAVIEQAKITDGFEIFLCRPSDDENGFRLEPVVGDWKELITGETSVGITPEVLLWRQEGAKRSHFTHYHFDDRPRDGETFAHFIAETVLFVSEEKRIKIPFHLFSREILSLKDSAECSVAVVMVANDVFPMETLSDGNIDTDPLVPFDLLFYSRTDGDDLDSFDRKLDEKILTKERLVNPFNAGDRWSGTGLAIPAALSSRIPESLRCDPDILQIKAGVG